MKTLLHSITRVSVAAVVVLAVRCNPVLLAQSDEPNEAKVIESARVNVDGNGVILKGYDTVGYLEQGKPMKGNSSLRAPIRAPDTYLPRHRIKPSLTKILQSMLRRTGNFAPTGYLKGPWTTSKVWAISLSTRVRFTSVATRARWRFLRLVSTPTSRRQTRTGEG